MEANPILLDEAEGDVVVVSIEGEHDIYTAPALRDRLDTALSRATGVGRGRQRAPAHPWGRQLGPPRRSRPTGD